MDRSVLVDQIVVVFIVRIVIFQGAFVDPDGKLHPVFVCPESVGGDRDTHRGRKDRFRISGQGEEKPVRLTGSFPHRAQCEILSEKVRIEEDWEK